MKVNRNRRQRQQKNRNASKLESASGNINTRSTLDEEFDDNEDNERKDMNINGSNSLASRKNRKEE